MLTTTSPESVSEWPLPPSTQSTVLAELTSPFGSPEIAALFWSEQSCQLIALTEQDDAQNYLKQNNYLSTPEFVIDVGHGWCLSLTVTSQAGGGTYLLFQACELPDLASLAYNNASDPNTF